MKIAHLTTVDISLRYFLLNQLRFLKENQFDVYAISSSGEHIPTIQNAGIKHISVKISRDFFSPLRDILSLIHLVKVLRKYKFQIVHAHTPKASFLGQIAAKIAGTPIIIRTVHGFYFHEHTHPLMRFFLIRMEKIVGKISDLIFSQNSEDIETAIKTGICEPEKIILLGNGINLKDYNPDQINPAKQTELRRNFNIQDDDRVIGFVGRLVEEKGLLDLFQAVRIVRESINNLKLLIIGTTDYAKKDAITPEMAQKYGISDLCVFAGLQEDMPLFYSLMDIFVLPAINEGIPRVAMEASAMGIPSILNNVRGCREVVRDGENGRLVPIKNIDVLSDAILDLLTDQQKANRMGMLSREKALREFDEQRVFDIVLTNYQKLIEEKQIRT
jgi:glycosyltransferase involved in cell wall biosynthesis